MTTGVKKAGRRTTGKRRRAREMALQMLYQRDLGGATVPQLLHHFDPHDLKDQHDNGPAPRREISDGALDYAHRLVSGTVDHVDEIDVIIGGQAENWRLERMSAVDRNVLRMAFYELLYELDVPHLVVVDEAIELAKKYGSDQSGRFVNGLLDGYLKRDSRSAKEGA